MENWRSIQKIEIPPWCCSAGGLSLTLSQAHRRESRRHREGLRMVNVAVLDTGVHLLLVYISDGGARGRGRCLRHKSRNYLNLRRAF
ncbi:hypothetical protein GBA52_025354 [Prunus armeniaca]|nr:hypothetical protein GBA52_025354 [Prunus armeniaca]